MRGRKPESRSTKVSRATNRPCRDNFELIASNDLPQQPQDFLTPGGQEVWLDLIGDVAQLGGTRPESMALALLANLLGAIKQACRQGEVPPASALVEVRRLLDAFGMCGAQSRIIRGGGKRQAENSPFTKFRG